MLGTDFSDIKLCNYRAEYLRKVTVLIFTGSLSFTQVLLHVRLTHVECPVCKER